MRTHGIPLVPLLGLALWGCEPPPAGGSAKSPPAKVVAEGDLNRIVLTDEAEMRLGIRIERVEKRTVTRTRTLGGEIQVPPGLEITVSSPLAGRLSPPIASANGTPRTVPAPGEDIRSGQPVFTLTPILPAEARVTVASARVEAAGEVEKAKVEVDAAEVEFQRAERLLGEKSGSQRDVDRARARLLSARAAFEAAGASRDLLEQIAAGTARDSAVSLPIVSPLDGILEEVHASAGQLVAAGAPLFDVLRIRRLWVRVPVYAGDLDRLNTERSVTIRQPGDPPRAPGQAAAPVAAPPSADPDAVTVDLFYEIDNADRRLRPGQRVSVTLPLGNGSESLVAPWSAVVHDIHGGAWVYEQIAPRTFRRRRVEVWHVEVRPDGGRVACLSRGPDAGTPVVADGAAELFGEEFGAAK